MGAEWIKNAPGISYSQKKKKKKNLNEEELFISTFWSSDTWSLQCVVCSWCSSLGDFICGSSSVLCCVMMFSVWSWGNTIREGSHMHSFHLRFFFNQEKPATYYKNNVVRSHLQWYSSSAAHWIKNYIWWLRFAQPVNRQEYENSTITTW